MPDVNGAAVIAVGLAGPSPFAAPVAESAAAATAVAAAPFPDFDPPSSTDDSWLYS